MTANGRTRRIVAVLLGAAIVLLIGAAALVRPDLPTEELEVRYAYPESTFAEVDGLRVHVRDVGGAEGPVVVLLHGSNASLHTWEGWTEELAEHFRVVSLDLPGHGLTGPDPHGRYRAAEMAEVVGAVVDELGIERFSLAGSSMGGGVALQYVLAHPERVERLILVGSVGYPREDGPPALYRVLGVPVIGDAARLITPRRAVARVLRTAYADPDRVEEETIDRYWHLLRREGNRAATVERMGLRREGDSVVADRLDEIDVPALILWGAADTWVPVRDAERFEQDLPDAQLVIYEDLGHIPMEEDPIRTSQDAERFLMERPEGLEGLTDTRRSG